MLLNIMTRFGSSAKQNVQILRLSNSACSKARAAYEGDGKTYIKILNKEPNMGLMVDSFGPYGFKLNNGVTVLGPVALFPRTVLSWQVRNSDAITTDSLRLFKLLEPKIDLVIIGLELEDRAKYDAVFRVARTAGLNVEILSTEHACSTFNFLNAEGRSIAAAMIPPMIVKVTDDDRLRSKMHYINMYNNNLWE